MVTRSLVSIVDDDESVRESLPDMVRQFGFAAQAFSSAEAFLAIGFRRPDSVSDPRCRDARNVWSRSSAGVGKSSTEDPDRLHHGQRRQNNPEPRTCGWSRRVPLQAVQRDGPPRCTQCRSSDELDMSMPGTRTTTGAPYTGSWAIGSHSIETVTMPDRTSIVFVVDDDISVRESLELLIRSAGWRAETFSVRTGLPSTTARACSVLSAA